MDIIEVSKHGQSVENSLATISNDNQEFISNEAEESTTLEHTLSVRHVQLQECGETQLGNKTKFHGSVDVNNIYEITTNEQFAKSLSNGDRLTTLPAISRAGAIGADLILPQPAAAAEIIREFNENLRSHERRHIHSSEHLPLISNNRNGNRKFRPKYIALLIIVSCVLCTSVILVIIYGHRKETDLPPAFTHRYRDRSKWYALPPKHQIPSFTYIPPLFVVVSQTVSSACSTPSACSVAVRNIQAAQMAGPYDDIAYSFLVAGDGLIYEGRGWHTRSADTKGMGCSSLGVAFVGKFMNVTPPQQQVEAFKLLLDTAESTGRLNKNYKMFMQKDITDLDSPGQQVINILENWDHAQPFAKEDLLC